MLERLKMSIALYIEETIDKIGQLFDKAHDFEEED